MLYKPPKPAREKRSKRPAVAVPFQTPAMALEDDEPPKVARWTLYVLAACLLAGAVWAFLASTDEIVAARGELVTTTPKFVVQPLERGIIREIRVKAGDVVHKGEVLARLDPTFAQADVETLRQKWLSFSARQARLTAEVAGKDYAIPASADAAQRLEAELFRQRKAAYAARLKSFAEDVLRFKASLQSTRRDIGKLRERIVLLNRIVAMRDALAKKALSSQLQLYEAQAQTVAAERDLVQDEGKVAELKHQVESTAAKRDAYADEWREKAQDELAKVRRDREEAAEDLKKAQRRHDVARLVAPADAVVLQVAPRSVGSVLQPAETLFTLVPRDAPLQAEVRVKSRDIGRIHVGNDVRIKIDAFPFQSHGTARGEVETISADSFQPNRRDAANGLAAGTSGAEPPPEPYYKVDVRLTDTALQNMPPKARLVPGMTATAEIDVGTRRVISYLLYPILKGLGESMHEP